MYHRRRFTRLASIDLAKINPHLLSRVCEDSDAVFYTLSVNLPDLPNLTCFARSLAAALALRYFAPVGSAGGGDKPISRDSIIDCRFSISHSLARAVDCSTVDPSAESTFDHSNFPPSRRSRDVKWIGRECEIPPSGDIFLPLNDSVMENYRHFIGASVTCQVTVTFVFYDYLF